MYNPANLFATCYSELQERLLVELGEAWWADPAFHDETQAVCADACDGTLSEPTFAHDRSTPEGQRERFALLRGIDAAYALLNPLHRAGPVPPGLALSQQWLAIHGRLNDRVEDGLVLPRLAWTTDRTDPPLLVRSAFSELTYAAPAVLKRSRMVAAPLRMRMSRELRIGGVVVGCLVATEDIGELDFTHGDDDQGDWYAGEMRDSPEIRERFEAALDDAARQGVHAMLLPELACSDKLLDFWKTALRRRGGAHNLRWAMVGSGNLRNGSKEHVNAAALVDAATGEVVALQHKQFPFDIVPQKIKTDYPLPFASGATTLRERIRPGYEVQVVDLGAARLTILICEDLARSDVLLDELRAVGVSHILAPVFSKPTMPFDWEQQKGRNWVDGSGATVVVGNSSAIGRLIEARNKRLEAQPLHTALAVSPWGFSAQRASKANEVLRFALRHGARPEPLDDPDGNVRPAAP